MTEKDDLERLTPEEMAALAEVLQPVQSADIDNTSAREDVILRYDLVGASSSPRHSMPVLDLVHDRFASDLAQQLARATRIEGTVEALPPSHRKCAEVYSELTNPCAIIAVDAVGLHTTGMFVADPILMMHLLDLCIGGTGASESVLEVLQERGFSKTEQRLSNHLVRFMGRALAKAWAELAEIELKVLRLESNPRHAIILDPGDAVVVFPVKLTWGEVSGVLRLVLPLSSLRPLESRLASTVVDMRKPVASPWQDFMQSHAMETPVELVVELGKTQLTLRQLLDLKKGELIRLDKEPNGPVEVQVEGSTKYIARPVVRHGNMAVEVLDVVVTDQNENETEL